jgi:type IX secretion system PorP/SprF family membrane protein
MYAHFLQFPSFMNKIWFSLLASLALCMPAFGQSFIQNTMYDYNRFVYNPATAGLGNKGTNQGWSFNALGRLQWVGIDGAPELVSLSGHRYIDGFGSIGGYIMQDELGPLSNTSINLSYALPLQIGDGHLSFGVSGGYSQRAINQTIIAIRTDDPVFNNGANFLQASTGVFNLSAGAFYQTKKFGYQQFFMGLSGQDLLEPSIDALKADPSPGGVSNIPRSFYFTSGYRIPMGFWSDNVYNYIQPTVMMRLQGSVMQSDISVLAKISALHAGLNYRGLWYAGNERGSESFGGILGFDMNEQLFFGYSYDLNLSALNANGDASSHELVLTFNLSAPDNNSIKGGGDVIKDGTDDQQFIGASVDRSKQGRKEAKEQEREAKKEAKEATKEPKEKLSKEEKEAAKEADKEAKEAQKARESRMTSRQKERAKEAEKAKKKAEKEAEKAAKKDEKEKARKKFKAKKKKAQKK